jgi:hypothetical protein
MSGALPAAPDGSGVVFVATGAAHVEAAQRAARSVRRSNPGLQIALFSDLEPPDREIDIWEPVPDPHARSKVDVLPRAPFNRTLFLDNDIRVVGDLRDMFGLLDAFDLAMAQVVRWHKPGYQRTWRRQLPACFPQYNSGVMLMRMTDGVVAFLEAWSAAYREAGFKEDQVTLRELLWDTPLRVATLPPQYNMRRYSLVDRYLSQRPPPRILHLPKYNPKKRRPIG